MIHLSKGRLFIVNHPHLLAERVPSERALEERGCMNVVTPYACLLAALAVKASFCWARRYLRSHGARRLKFAFQRARA